MKVLLAGLLSCLALLASPHAYASPVTIDNGVSGDGAWRVDVGFGGDSITGILDPAGSIGPNNVIFALLTVVDPGSDGGGIGLSSTTITSEPTLTAPGQVSSSGTFAGVNGAVNWNSISRIAPGSLIYQNTVTFTSAAAFGSLRVLCYLDEDVVGSSDDIMVLFGTPGQTNFNVLTVDNTDNFGVAHAAGYLTATNATYVGWAADQYSDLINAIANSGTNYSIPGVIDTTSLPPITDARYPGRPVYGPNDITNAFAFDVTPTATTATIACSLGGLPTGQPPALTISKTAASSAVIGSDLAYTIRYANTGAAATGVAIRDRLPMGATFVSASNGGTLAGDTVTWNVGDLPANSGDRTLTLTVRVTGVAGSILTNADYSISGTGIAMVAGAPVSTTLTAATVVIPPIVPNATACAVVPLPANVGSFASGLSSDANFVFFGVPDRARPDPRCTNLPDFCGPIREVSVFSRTLQTPAVVTRNSPQNWDLVRGLSSNKAYIATDAIASGVSFQYSGTRLSSVGYPIINNGQIVNVPARRGDVLLTDAATATAMPIRTPFRAATMAAGMAWSGHFVAASSDGNRILLVEAAYDSAGVVVDGGLNFVDISMQTSFDLFNRIRTLAGIAPTASIGLSVLDAMSGDGNRYAFSSTVALTGTNAGRTVEQLPGNTYGLRELAYVFDLQANSLTLVAQPDTSRARPSGASNRYIVRSLGATGALVALDRTVPFLNTPGNPEQNGEIYIAQPGIGISQVTSTPLPRSGDYLSPGLSFITPNERFVYFQAQQNLVGRNADQSNELFRYDIQTGQLKQVTTRFDAIADLLASLGISPSAGVGQLVGDQTSFDGRFVLLQTNGIQTASDLGFGGRGVVAEGATLYDCQ